jgi:hypothetical protein
MQEAEVRAMLEEMFRRMDPEFEYGHRHSDCVIDIPQSGEVFDTEAMREMQRAFPDPPEIRLTRLAGEGDVWVAETESDYSGQLFHMAMILEFEGDKIIRETRYYAEPFEPPEWRAPWAKRT